MVWFHFLCLMTYQFSQVISYQSHSCRKIAGGMSEFIPFPWIFAQKWKWMYEWKSNLLTVMSQFSILITIPLGLPFLENINSLKNTMCEVSHNAQEHINHKKMKILLTHSNILKVTFLWQKYFINFTLNLLKILSKTLQRKF